jgi:hypothetical protein
MPFTIEIESIESDSRRIMPISMRQRYHSGERLQALIEWAQGSNTTLLIADYLQRHNLGDEKKALRQGNQFLRQHGAILKDSIVIEDAESWEKYKGLSVVKLMRWKTWAEIHPQEVASAQLLMEEQSFEGSPLLQAMKRVASRCFSTYSEESSIAYQKEENAYLLTFTCFDDHIYPKPLNDSQAEIYRQWYETLPRHRVPRFIPLLHSSSAPRGSFWAHPPEDPLEEEKKAFPTKEKHSLHPMLRMVLMNLEMALNSSEVSPQSKVEFARQCTHIFAASGLACDADLEDSCAKARPFPLY